MCARLLACPLCSQPSFLTLDELRAGLVNVATRPIACPVCNEVMLGIDKLTIHLFGHTINQNANLEPTKIIEMTTVGSGNTEAIQIHNAQTVPVQSWNVLNTAQTIEQNNIQNKNKENSGSGIYIPIDEIETFRNLTRLKDGSNSIISVNNGQNSMSDIKASSQIIFVQNVETQSKIFSANLVSQSTDNPESLTANTFQANPITTTTTLTKEQAVTANSIISQEENINTNNANSTNVAENSMVIAPVDNTTNESPQEPFTPQTSWNNANESVEPHQFPPSHTDRLAELVKNAQITNSPLGTFHESYDCSKPEPAPKPSSKPITKSMRILSASEKTERCNVCGFHFPDRNILILHKQLVHMIQKKDSNVAPEDLMKNYPCHLCTKIFKMKGSLMVHMRVAHPKFNTTGNIRESLQKKREQSKDTDTTHTNDNESGYNCPTCGKHFKKEQHVTQHLKIHEGKQWECEICSKMFTTKYFLKKHKRLHSGEMPYRCNICDKTFTFQQSYHKHRLYHKDDKPHSCNTCGRSFKELSTLHNHERIHTGEKPFACETCGKCFRQRVSYLVHRRIHTGVMPYKCSTCGKNFRYKVSQRNHKCSQQINKDEQESETTTEQASKISKMNDSQQSPPLEEQNVNPLSTNEENQYVLILNIEGQHILKRQSDIENENEKRLSENAIELDKEQTSQSSDFLRNIWNQETSNGSEYKDNSSKSDELSRIIREANLWDETSNSKSNFKISNDNTSNDAKKISNEFTNNLWNQTPINGASLDKSPSNNHTDYFSMVMSPLENGISSPSTEMEHLRLSSPLNNQENSSENTSCFLPMNNNANAIQVEHNNTDESFSQNNVNLSTLQTIKSALYSSETLKSTVEPKLKIFCDDLSTQW